MPKHFILLLTALLLSAQSALAQTADTYQPSLEHLLYNRIGAGDLDAVHELLEQGADPNATHGSQLAPMLLHAAGFAQPQIVDLLLDYGADVNGQADNHFGALHWAVLQGTHRGKPQSTEVVRRLLARGADPNIGAPHVDTPLMRSVFYAEPAVWQLLLDAGADIGYRNQYKLTALHFAIRSGHQEAVNFFVGAGAPRSDLFTAAGANDTARMRELLAEGHTVNGYDWQGRSVLDWARGVNAPDAEALLISLGAVSGIELAAARWVDEKWLELLGALRMSSDPVE